MNQLKKLKSNNFISSADISYEETLYLLNLASSFKNNKLNIEFKNKVLGLIFDKASTRTRVSFQVAMSRLGGNAIDLNPQTTQIGRGEPIKDTARVLSRYCDILAIRTYKNDDLLEYAKWSSKPVINALTDLEHPCQALADYLTIKEEFGNLDNLVLTFIGDGNNVAHSLILSGIILGLKIRIICPKGFEPNTTIVNKAFELKKYKDQLTITDNIKSVSGSDVIYTDVWASMGQEKEKDSKEKIFKNFSITNKTLNLAKKEAIVLHCLPAYRGKEITDEVFECKQSRIFNQAENRLHAQQALLSSLL
tara:strand:+ start:622 stop:1542 length:921 start_codon:yes stop_codon:yes gene_type:complete